MKRAFNTIVCIRDKSHPLAKSTRFACAVGGLLVAVLILGGCAPRWKDAYQRPGHEKLCRMKNVGVHVKMRRGFAVRLGYHTSTDDIALLEGSAQVGLIGGVLGVLGNAASAKLVAGEAVLVAGIPPVGAVIGEFDPDRKATREFMRKLGPINSADAIGIALVKHFHSASVFPAITFLSSESRTYAREHGTDAILSCTVRRWGLRHPLMAKRRRGDQAPAQLELDMTLRLVSVATGKVLWRRDQYYLDSESYTLGKFRSETGLLTGRMEHALQRVCTMTANELRRTRYNQEVM